MLYHEAPLKWPTGNASSCGKEPRINWSGADSRNHEALYKPLMNIVFFSQLPSFPISSARKTHDEPKVFSTPDFLFQHAHSFGWFPLETKVTVQNLQIFAWRPTAWVWISRHSLNAEECGPGVMGFWFFQNGVWQPSWFWNKQNIEKWKQSIQHHVKNNGNKRKWRDTLRNQRKETTNMKAYTPWKINMEPTNHPFWNETDLPNLYDYVLQGCSPSHWLSDFFGKLPRFQSFRKLMVVDATKKLPDTSSVGSRVQNPYCITFSLKLIGLQGSWDPDWVL